MITRDFIEAVREDKDYDYVCNHYWEMSKEELKDAYKELNYAIYSFLSDSDYSIFKSQYVEALEEIYEED